MLRAWWPPTLRRRIRRLEEHNAWLMARLEDAVQVQELLVRNGSPAVCRRAPDAELIKGES